MDDLKQRLRRPDAMTIDQCFACMAEADAALEAKDAEIARKDAAIREHIAFMESTGFSTRFLDGLRAALSATTKE